jgi:thiosulfate/3-mercaptopyruvate sulfurtransferase
VLYSANHIMWATRIWWMLRAFGFDAGAVLDGGWEKWRDEGRPISIEPCQYPLAQFVPRQRLGLFVDKQAVLTALDDPQVCLLNALRPEYHKGEDPSRYGRAGRIPGSVNVPGRELTRPDTYEFISMAEACARFEAVGAKKEKRIIAYCGGGIAATVDLFLLHQLGYEEIALYDASLGEWAQDESLPLETG